MEISSPAFRRGEAIPRKYTCDGDDASPPLAISGVPPEAKALALLMEDPDAPIGVFTHWILYDVQPSLKELPEAVPRRPEVAGLGLQGVNDFGRVGYGGPCPPRGHGPHRYFFRLYALSAPLGLGPKASRGDFLKALQGKVLAQAEYMGTYKR
ncbi:MAG: phosphatidylethanolamine-binding protein [Thermoproteus sp. JCHS_4]|jgi:phospholipid-binding protein, PBP family|nr:MAG: phosphatidylethanolamine-binding protein [Thermoproteus sp. JCHS_4]